MAFEDEYRRTGHDLDMFSTLKLQSSFFIEGLRNAVQLSALFAIISEAPHLVSNLTKAVVVQVILLVSTVAIQPSLAVGNARSSFILIGFNFFYILPLCLISVYFTGLFSISTLSAKKRSTTQSVQSSSQRILSNSNKVLVLFNYVLFAYLLKLIPFVGSPLAFFFCCLANSFYLYEPTWVLNSKPFAERISTLETHWCYMIGFGLPITLISFFFSNPIINFSLFSLFFPFTTLLTQSSIPQPLDPALPTAALTISILPAKASSSKGGAGGRRHGASASFSMANAEGGEESSGRANHFIFPIRVRIFILASFAFSSLESLLGGGRSIGKKKEANGWRGDTPTRYNNGSANYSTSNGNGNGNAGSYGNQGGQQQQQQYKSYQQQSHSYYNDSPGQNPNPNPYSQQSSQFSPPRAASNSQFSNGQQPTPPPRRTHTANDSSVGVTSNPIKIGGELNSISEGGSIGGVGMTSGMSNGAGGANSRSKKD